MGVPALQDGSSSPPPPAPFSSQLGGRGSRSTGSGSWLGPGLPRSRAGQREVKRGAGIDAAFGPGASAVTGDDPAHIGQPDARAFEFIRPMQPLKRGEEPPGIRRLETRTVVLDRKLPA